MKIIYLYYDIEQHLRGVVQLATYTISQKNKSTFLVLQILERDKYKLEIILSKLNLNGYFENPQIKTLLAFRKRLYNTLRLIKNYEED